MEMIAPSDCQVGVVCCAWQNLQTLNANPSSRSWQVLLHESCLFNGKVSLTHQSWQT